MASDIREVAEGIQYQGEDEEIAYTLDVTAWGASPTSPGVKVKDGATDVTATVMPAGSPTVVGNVITLPRLKLLEKDKLYRVEVKFTISGNVLEAYFHVQAQE